MQVQTVKCVVVGDGAVGKTCLLSAYTTNSFPGDYAPTVFDNYSASLTLQPAASAASKDKSSGAASTAEPILVSMGLWDTAGQEDYDRIRPLTYPDTDVFLVCYSVLNRKSLANALGKWASEVRRATRASVPLVLVGCKRDLREAKDAPALEAGTATATTDTPALQIEERGQEPITEEEGRRAAEELGAVAFFECSALKRQGLAEVFEGAARVVVMPGSLQDKGGAGGAVTPASSRKKSKSRSGSATNISTTGAAGESQSARQVPEEGKESRMCTCCFRAKKPARQPAN